MNNHKLSGKDEPKLWREESRERQGKIKTETRLITYHYGLKEISFNRKKEFHCFYDSIPIQLRIG